MNWLQALRDRYGVTADPLRTQRRIELAALVLGCALCLQLVYGGVRLATLGAPDEVEPAADSMQVPRVLSREAVAAGERREVISRPVFWASRRPVAAAAAEPPPSRAGTAALRDVKQVGVFGSGEEAGVIALVKGKKRRILLGESLDGWTLESINSTESEFANGERRETLTLERGNVAAKGSAATAIPVSGPTPQNVPVAGGGGETQAQAAPSVPRAGGAPGETNQADTEPELGLGQRGWGQRARD